LTLLEAHDRMHLRWKVVQQHWVVCGGSLESRADAAEEDGGEQDQEGWRGWMALKQIMQSGYGGVLKAWMRVEVRSLCLGGAAGCLR
jgi:hypothetical protein